jgi:hypothetical protein
MAIMEQEAEDDEVERGNSITREEFDKAVKKLKYKIPQRDRIPARAYQGSRRKAKPNAI